MFKYVYKSYNCGRTTSDFRRKASVAPLKVEIAELRYFNENSANQKYDQVLKKLTEQKKECKEIKTENKFLKSTVNTCAWFSEQETNGKFNIRFQGPNHQEHNWW